LSGSESKNFNLLKFTSKLFLVIEFMLIKFFLFIVERNPNPSEHEKLIIDDKIYYHLLPE
jgi:hypothetical protein